MRPADHAALRRLGRKVVGGRRTCCARPSAFRAAGPALVGKRIVIDPGHGGGDPGVGVPDGPLRWTEADLAYDLASRLEGRLAAAGMRVHLTRGPPPSAALTELDRAALANELGADLLISLHLDGHANPAADGVATYHYGQYGEAASPRRWASGWPRWCSARSWCAPGCATAASTPRPGTCCG